MIGPYDLSGSYGFPGDIEHELIKEASLKVIEACKKNGKSCGTQISNPNLDNIKELTERGYTFIIMGSDLFALTNWAQNIKKMIQISK